MRLSASEIKSCVNDSYLIKPEYLNDCRKTKSTVRQMPKAGLCVGAAPRAGFSSALSIYNTQE